MLTWTKCSEQMPPNGRTVLAYFPGGLIHTAVRSLEPGYERPQWFCDIITRHGMMPTHWAEYTPPPQER